MAVWYPRILAAWYLRHIGSLMPSVVGSLISPVCCQCARDIASILAVWCHLYVGSLILPGYNVWYLRYTGSLKYIGRDGTSSILAVWYCQYWPCDVAGILAVWYHQYMYIIGSLRPPIIIVLKSKFINYEELIFNFIFTNNLL